ncbi:MAG: hypothetical protein KGO51_01795 [Alphaproteobacteria bacterium]|nr:hypothetical protein [Alphaproteobacteria bacterium]
MCAVPLLALIALPLAGGVFGYLRFGATGAWAGALAGLVLGLALGAAPIAILASAERRKRRARDEIEP